jgi:hypothetical protein
MNTLDVTFVRIYLTEGKGQLDPLMKKLHDEEKVHGVTVFRGISGFGKSGRMHSSSLLDMSLDLPLVVEFFDTPEKARAILEHLSTTFEPGHIVHWSATLHV